MRVLLGTHNPHKLAEFIRILGDIPGVHWQRPDELGCPEIEETGRSLEENARLKAHQAAQATGLPTLAEDSGLEVNALGGEPGVRSARYAGETKDHQANIALLLRRLQGVEDRTAQFRAVAVLALPDGRWWQTEGILRGRICEAPRGEAGFGYDPVFVPEAGPLTLAQLPPEAKDRISHRRRALEAMRPVLAKLEAKL